MPGPWVPKVEARRCLNFRKREDFSGAGADTKKSTYSVKRDKELANESFILIYAEIRKQKHPYH